MWIALSVWLFTPIGAAIAQPDNGENEAFVRFKDPSGDAVPRRTDPDGAGVIDIVQHRLPDLLELRLGAWTPNQPTQNLFVGDFVGDGSDANFFRMDLVLQGLMNPPGDVHPATFDPFRYGPNPVYGFVELDMDEDVNTGGELLAPQYRYLGNVVRFGGRIDEGPIAGREALDASAFDGDITTPPLVDRSGEEFHFVLLGGEFSDAQIRKLTGDSDDLFEVGETWQITAPFFHRAHGYEEFSFIEGGMLSGQYMPPVTVQFQHDPVANQTTVSLVFPLTQVGAGLQRNEPTEPIDFDPTNAVSIEEALSDLVFSAQFFEKFPTNDPNEDIIRLWAAKNPQDFLEPQSWRPTVLLGSSYVFPLPDGVFYVWSDVFPNVVRGDVDGSGDVDDDDVRLIQQFLNHHDLDDGTADRVVEIAEFAQNFSLFDVNHDGRVDGLDLLCAQADGDTDEDNDVDLRDFARLQDCIGVETLGDLECAGADLDLNGVTDEDDLSWFVHIFTGPIHP